MEHFGENGFFARPEEDDPGSRQVVDIIRERILSGDLAPGDRLVERTLAAELGISRIPVRDALNILRGEGFVTAYPNRGMLVTKLGEQDIEEFFSVLEALDVLVAQNAANNASLRELNQMRDEILRAEDPARKVTAMPQGRCCENFHNSLLKSAKNTLLSNMMAPLAGRLRHLLQANQRLDLLHEQHVNLLDAVRGGNCNKAAEQARLHVQTSRDIWLELTSHAGAAVRLGAAAGTAVATSVATSVGAPQAVVA